MSFLSKVVVSGLITGTIFLTGLFGAHLFAPTSTPAQTFGGTSFTPAQIPQTTLSGAGITSSQTTIPLTALTTADGRAVTMSMLGTIGYGTLEPNATSKEEIITFTGITQNANGSAILTGVTRGLDFVFPYAASTTLQKQHAGGSYFIISNTAPFYGQQFLLQNLQGTSTAGIVFSSTTPPYYDYNPTFGNVSSTTLASKGYVDSTAITGASPISSTVAGVGLLATALQAASSTATGIFNALSYNRVLAASYATDTPQNCTGNGITTGGCVVVTLLTGKISQAFLDIFATANTWSLLQTFTKGITSNATTTLNCSNVNSNGCIFNGVTYSLPSSLGASSTILQTDANGKTTWETFGFEVGTTTGTTTTHSGTGSTPETTLATITVPGNLIGTGGALYFDLPFSTVTSSGGSGSTDDLKVKLGSTTLFDRTYSLSAGSSLNAAILRVRILSNGATNSQFNEYSFLATNNTQSNATLAGLNDQTSGVSTEDMTADKTLSVTMTITGTAGESTNFTTVGGNVYILRK